MNRRKFAAGALIGAVLAGVALFAGAAAFQNGSMPGLGAGEQAFTGENLAFVTSEPSSNPFEGRLMVQVDGQWRDVQFEMRMTPAN